MTDAEHHRINSLTEKARSAMSNARQDDQVKQAAVIANGAPQPRRVRT